mmetsp:Transcript_30570/g.42168  ORF Transcript_30570/g.42168 Transcript_30570/m.42168 type:complete len:751 (+) Transcript_30570:52-2304(+)|eukprot:CAMPEP_0201487170 /NCGR_PEP_ID=MMETSP0151_2-20130828/11156_1 /ASSEMBLY_ACC=CAM_ASM_000257 /TAXON_ID=200890 /ORGANISM="Paramoeba atlantica, Strain 621/1 / CCAP 1560/9" /LENGTH=750 /DNA_ID=CAMNT_0047872153 /DNA_START=7 /DNA_END=2259 /DNA_ORIENTATION=-
MSANPATETAPVPEIPIPADMSHPTPEGVPLGTEPTTSATLYVGNITPEISEPALFAFFSKHSPVTSVRVCRDLNTQASLGYGYVNFSCTEDAEKSLNALNYVPIRPGAKPMRLMWYERDPTKRKSGHGNIFIKNLTKDVDDKSLAKIFAKFGAITSAKVGRTRKGESMGHGFVQFENDSEADTAIAEMNGAKINDLELYVGPFKSTKERFGEQDGSYTNVFLRNLKPDLTTDALKEYLSKFGKVVSVSELTESKQFKAKFGFASFESHEEALKCVEELNDKVIEEIGGDLTLFAGRAMKSAERMKAVQYAATEDGKGAEFLEGNVYVKNIPDGFTTEKLTELFSKIGEVSSAVVMQDTTTGLSKGYGFVRFKSREDADRAISVLNGKLVAGKPLLVTPFLNLQQRRRYRETQATGGASTAGLPTALPTYPGAPGHPRWPLPHAYPTASAHPGLPPSGIPPLAGPYGTASPSYYGGSPYPAVMSAMGRGGGVGGPGGYPPRGGMIPGRGMGAPGGVAVPGGTPATGANPMGMAPARMPYGYPPRVPPSAMPGMGMHPPGNPHLGVNPNLVNPRPHPFSQAGMMMQGGGRGAGVPPVGAGGVPAGMLPPAGGVAGPQPHLMRPKMPAMAPAVPQRPGVQGMPTSAYGSGPQAPAQPSVTPPPPVKSIPGFQGLPPLTSSALAAMSEEEQKNALGERLYARIESQEPEQAAKITGMLLEMDTTEILNVLEDPNILQSKLSEALNVLRAYKSA